MNFLNRTFEDAQVGLDGGHYEGCTFRRCEIVFAGGGCHLNGCAFEECSFTFDEAAGRTLQFLHSLSQVPGGRELILATFPGLGSLPGTRIH